MSRILSQILSRILIWAPILISSLSLTAQAAAVQYQTLGQARAQNQYHIYCYTRSGSPQVYATYYHNFSIDTGPSGTVVVVQPREGIYNRNLVSVPTTIGIPPTNWSVSPAVTSMTITGTFQTPYNERAVIFMNDDDDGTFDGTLTYNNYTTGVSVQRDVRCLASSQSWAPAP